MLKEIHEQPDVLARTAFERIDEARGDAVLEGEAFSGSEASGYTGGTATINALCQHRRRHNVSSEKTLRSPWPLLLVSALHFAE